VQFDSFGISTHKFNIQEKEVKECENVEDIEGDLLEKEIKFYGLSLPHSY